LYGGDFEKSAWMLAGSASSVYHFSKSNYKEYKINPLCAVGTFKSTQNLYKPGFVVALPYGELS